MKNPETAGLKPYKENGEPTLAFKEYVRIAKALRLLDHAQQIAAATGYWRRLFDILVILFVWAVLSLLLYIR